MGEYRVQHNYRSTRVAFVKGDVVELEDETAEWVNRDSPGCLKPARKHVDDPIVPDVAPDATAPPVGAADPDVPAEPAAGDVAANAAVAEGTGAATPDKKASKAK